MKGNVKLYKKPFIVGIVFVILSFLLIIWGIDFINSSEYPDGGYALCLFGFLFLISAIIILLVYGSLERKFRIAIADPMLSYYLPPKQFSETEKDRVADIKSSNKTLLIIMLIFSFAIMLSGFFIENNGYILIFTGLAISLFLIISKIVITTYRTHKIQNSSRLIILSRSGAFVCGEFHCWGTPATALKSITLLENANTDEIAAYIEIEYTAASLPSAGIYKFRIPVLPSYLENAAIAVKKIETEWNIL